MDVTQSLKEAENALRDFIVYVLSKSIGENWPDQCGVTKARVGKWKERQTIEIKRLGGKGVEERLIYFADFFDLKTILRKKWESEFSEVFGEWKQMDVFLSILEDFRDPDAHRRELLPHQKQLALGISGEIRSQIVRYRSSKETVEDYFPRIESARDSLGNSWKASDGGVTVHTGNVSRMGDVIDFVIIARDPEDLQLEYGIKHDGTLYAIEWQASPEFQVKIDGRHVGKTTDFNLYIKSPRRFHASKEYDAAVIFLYDVLPRE